MGRKNKYEEYVKPYLEDITEMYKDMDEKQISDRLGISQSTFDNYKKKYPELRDAIKKAKTNLSTEMKSVLKKKAMGYYYEETKTYIRDDNGKKIQVVEKYKKYAHPDTGAIHLILKNIDENWHNDDNISIEMKKKQLELNERKIANDEW